MKKRALILLVLSIVVFGGGAWLAQETNLFLSPRAKQLAYLKEHEEEIVNVYGGFNHIESSSWNVTFDIENDKIIPNSMALANYLRMGGRIFD